MIKVVKDIISLFAPYSDGILLEGSSAWDNIRVGLDIDLEFLVQDFTFFEKLDIQHLKIEDLKEVIKNYLNSVSQPISALDLEMFSLKIFPFEHEISLRFTKSTLFSHICSLDLVKIDKSISTFQYRLYQTKKFDYQKNFIGEALSYKRWGFSWKKQQVIETPLVIIDNKGRFYPGGVIDRYLSFPKILYQKDTFCYRNLSNLKINLVKRVLLEEKRKLHKDIPSLSLCLSRAERICKRKLSHLKREEDILKKQLIRDNQFIEDERTRTVC